MSSHQQTQQSHLSNDFIVAEFTALREEILKLTDMQHQLVAITVLTFGTLMVGGIQYKNASIILVYPVLALFLSAGWFTHAYGIDMLGHYIQRHIEVKVGIENIGWENHSRNNSIPHYILAFLGARGIFPVTQVIAIIVGISLASYNIPLFFIGVASTLTCIILIMTLALAQRKRKRLVHYSPS